MFKNFYVKKFLRKNLPVSFAWDWFSVPALSSGQWSSSFGKEALCYEWVFHSELVEPHPVYPMHRKKNQTESFNNFQFTFRIN